MPDSPSMNSSEVIKVSITSMGIQLNDQIQILSIAIRNSINKIPYAKIILVDGEMSEKDFPISNGDEFKPGAEISILGGYGASEEIIFEGIVVKHGIKISGANDSRLIIECRDKTVAMTLGRKNVNYIESKDSDIISTLIGGYNGLSADVEATNTQYDELVQYYCTDWDFMLSRAEINGLLICINSGKISVKPPQVGDAAKLVVTYGEDLIEFQADIDARTQFKAVVSTSWDPNKQEVIEEKISAQKLNKQGNLSSDELAKVINLESFRLQTSTPLEKTALDDWASGQQVKSALSKIRGRIKFQGNSNAITGSLLELAGVGERFNGEVFISSVSHDIFDGNWFTEVEFGMSPDWFAEQRDIVAPPASGFVPGIEGLQIGVVMKLDEDPCAQNRIQVSVPSLQAETAGVWARLANFYASNNFGAFFVPEIGDEVILGYLNNDPSHPIILGSLYSGKLTPPYELTADNSIKAIVTKSQLKLEFDDENKVTTIVTPDKNTIVFSDKDKSILVQDQNGNKFELGEAGIVMDSPKDISIVAKGKISIEATENLTLSSQADVSQKGLNINHEASVGFTAKGDASAELSASGQTTIKGAMVMIN